MLLFLCHLLLSVKNEGIEEKKSFAGVVVYEYELKIGWGKSVALPSQALPAPPPGQMAIRSKEVRYYSLLLYVFHYLVRATCFSLEFDGFAYSVLRRIWSAVLYLFSLLLYHINFIIPMRELIVQILRFLIAGCHCNPVWSIRPTCYLCPKSEFRTGNLLVLSDCLPLSIVCMLIQIIHTWSY